MKKKLIFTWIDDDPEREEVANTFAKRLKINVNFIGVKNLKLHDILSKLLKKAQPDLLLIDHRLDKAVSDLFKTGFTAAAFIREKWPTCPIICITGIDKDDFKSQEHSLYQETFEINKISDHDAEILSIAESFKYLRNKQFKDSEALIKTIKAPQTDHYKLISILPQDVKEHLADKSLSIYFSKWVRDTLFDRPGFLYDRLWIATLIGLKEKSFKKVEYLFTDALYKGIFQNKTEERWWKSEVLITLAKLVNDENLPWKAGRNLPNIKKADYSQDYVNDADYPETVAYFDQSVSSKQYAMKLKDTAPHPDYEDLLYFDTIRIMKAEHDD